MDTVTPGSTPPDWSVTVPSIAPPAACAWASTGEGRAARPMATSTTTNTGTSFLVIDSSPVDRQRKSRRRERIARRLECQLGQATLVHGGGTGQTSRPHRECQRKEAAV